MKPRPIQDQVLVLQDKPAEKLGSLFLPDSKKRALQPDTGTVIAVGPGRALGDGARTLMDVQVGDRVYFKRQPDTALVADRRDLATGLNLRGLEGHEDELMLRNDDILAVMEN
jgi:chaperonin GroES